MNPRPLFYWLGCVVTLSCAATTARAQAQDARMDEILGADRTRASSFADKTFATSAAVGGKQARVKSYNFGSKSSVFGGKDGKFRTKAYNDPRGDGFRVKSYAVKASDLSQRNSFAQGDRTFGTKSMDVREAPSANKTLPVRAFAKADQTFYGRGKRQDFLDEQTQGAKNLSIDQVRALLNKGPEAKQGTLLEPMVPVVRQPE